MEQSTSQTRTLSFSPYFHHCVCSIDISPFASLGLPRLIFKVLVSASWPWHFVVQCLNLLLLSVIAYLTAE
jgi:hypothetical protein